MFISSIGTVLRNGIRPACLGAEVDGVTVRAGYISAGS